MRRFVASAVALASVLFVSVAAACPVCASREEPTSLRWYALGAFILTPWFVAGAIALYIRKGWLAEQRSTLPTAVALPTALPLTPENFE